MTTTDSPLNFFGRRVWVTKLDPIPRAFRAAPGIIVLNQREIDSLESDNGDVFKDIADICRAEDAAEVRLIGAYQQLGTKRVRRRR